MRNNYEVIDTVPKGYVSGDCHNWLWSKDVLNNIRYRTTKVTSATGYNERANRPIDTGLVLQKIVIMKSNTSILPTYLGPTETFRI